MDEAPAVKLLGVALSVGHIVQMAIMTEREACAITVNDTCNTSPCPTSQYKWAGIIAGEDGPVIVAPNATIVVYTGMYYGANTDFGDYSLNVRTESLQ